VVEPVDNISGNFVGVELMSFQELTDLLEIQAVSVTGFQAEQDRVDIFIEPNESSAICPSCGV
jgi:hypothetical protein